MNNLALSTLRWSFTLEVLELSSSDLVAKLNSPSEMELLSPVAGVCAIVVDGEIGNVRVPSVPVCPLINVNSVFESELCDITYDMGMSLDLLLDGIKRSPMAAAALVAIVRIYEETPIWQALVEESLTYSTLQHGAEFKAWLAEQPQRQTKAFDGPPIIASRSGETLTLTLNRPQNRNAWSTDMRDALAENLQLVLMDESIEHIHLRANGPCFGAGGDLSEFGDARDAAEAHITRLTRSPAWSMALLSDKITAHLHGACVGAGIELPAYASKIQAQQDTVFQLPEVSMGLIPGAGGIASILPRMGPSYFNYFALSGERLSVERAFEWGLIDEIVVKEDFGA